MSRLRSLMRSLAANPAQFNKVWLSVTMLLGLLYAGRILFLVYSVGDNLQQLSALRSDELISDVTQIGPLVQALNEDLTALNLEARPLTQLLRFLEFVPEVGPDLAAVGPLVDAAAATAYAADTTWQTVAPALQSQPTQPRLGILLASVRSRQMNLLSAQSALRKAIEARDYLPGNLSATFQTQVNRLDAYLPLMDHTLTTLLALPNVLGDGQPQTYLLLAQNSDELRATGGFISSVGILRVSQGNLDLSFQNSYAIDDYARHAYPPPPAPLHTYMGADLWLFRDSNWSADYPESANTVAALYALGQREQVAGVIAFDQTAVRYLLEGLGPITLRDGSTITADTIVEQLRSTWTPEPANFSPAADRAQPGLLNDLGKTLMARLLIEPQTLNLSNLLAATVRALEEKHLLIVARDSGLSSIMSVEAWNGAVAPNEEDYLYVVDSNVGFNKANALVQRSIDYTVDLSDVEHPTAHLNVHYQLPGTVTATCQHIDPAYGSRDYAYETQKCYWNYLRVYAPNGAKLVASTSLPTSAAWLWNNRFDPGWVHQTERDDGTVEFNQFFVVPIGQSLSTSLTYDLPATVIHYEATTFTYCLDLIKQPGTDTTPSQITLTLPVESHLIAASPTATVLDNSDLIFDPVTLRTDQRLCATFARP